MVAAAAGLVIGSLATDPAAAGPKAPPYATAEHCSRQHRSPKQLDCEIPGGGAIRADFNIDGFADLAVGVPREDFGDLFDVGAVHVLFGSPTGLQASGALFLHQDGAGVPDQNEPGDRFGGALAAGDFNGDGRTDLAVGAPGEDGDEGAVFVFASTTSGLRPSGVSRFAIAGPAHTGASLAAGDFDGAGRDELAIGSALGTVGSHVEAGVVEIVTLSFSGTGGSFSATVRQTWTQDDAGTGVARAGERFGFSLAAADYNGDERDDLAIGAPLDDRALNGFLGSGVDGTGTVSVLHGSAGLITATGSQFWSQEPLVGDLEHNDLFGSRLAAGDFNGDGRDDLAVGVPGEDQAGTTNSGGVNVIYAASGGLTVTGNEFLGGGRSLDRMGSALAARDFNRDGKHDLAVGVPFADSDVADSGAVRVYPGAVQGGVPSTPTVVLTPIGLHRNRANFGAALSWGDYNGDGIADLAVGVPGRAHAPAQFAQPVSAVGAIEIIDGSTSGLRAGSGRKTFVQCDLGDECEADDRFGSTLY